MHLWKQIGSKLIQTQINMNKRNNSTIKTIYKSLVSKQAYHITIILMVMLTIRHHVHFALQQTHKTITILVDRLDRINQWLNHSWTSNKSKTSPICWETMMDSGWCRQGTHYPISRCQVDRTITTKERVLIWIWRRCLMMTYSINHNIKIKLMKTMIIVISTNMLQLHHSTYN